MALKIEKHGNGYLFNKKIHLLVDGGDHDTKYINLAIQTGPEMQYGNHDLSFIEYPGEYEIDGIYFKVFSGKGGELNYLILQEGEKPYAFVQTEDALQNDEFLADNWIFVNPHMAKVLDKMELEGEKIDLNTIE